jgi:TetR/AcrR family tetracycline transcriptional repressor
VEKSKKARSLADCKQGSGSRRKGPEEPLLREHIVATALAIVDGDGLKALSMRRLGAELGVDPMAIYYHIPNKEALLDAIVEAVMGSIDLSLDRPADPPEERILRAANAYLKTLLAHVHALPIVLVRGPATPAAMRPVECLLGILRDAGLSPTQAFAGMHVIAAVVRGAVVEEAASAKIQQRTPEQVEQMLRTHPETFPHLLESMPFAEDFCEHGFEFGIRVIARGLLAEARKGEPA